MTTHQSLRQAIADHAPSLLADYDAHWARGVEETAVPAFLARWGAEYAVARDPRLDAHVAGLEDQAAEAIVPGEALVLLNEAARLRAEAVQATVV